MYLRLTFKFNQAKVIFLDNFLKKRWITKSKFTLKVQRLIQNPVKHLRWSSLLKWITVFSRWLFSHIAWSKMVGLTEFWIYLWNITNMPRKYRKWILYIIYFQQNGKYYVYDEEDSTRLYLWFSFKLKYDKA